MCFPSSTATAVLYGSWQFSGIVTQGQTAKNRGVVHDSCDSGEGWGGREEVCVRVCVGGDSENESCRIRFGSETSEEPTKRGVLQAAGRFITRCSLCTYRPSPSTSRLQSTPPPPPPHLERQRGSSRAKIKKRGRSEYIM